MKLYVYVDESGVFDKRRGEPFVYGGVMVFADNREDATRRYIGLENEIRRESPDLAEERELKANLLTMRQRSRIFRSLRGFGCYQFASITDQSRVFDSIYSNKRDKQKFQDYALKRAIKTGVLTLFSCGWERSYVDAMGVVVDEHSTSTSGRYDLEGTINAEFRYGTYNRSYTQRFTPVFGPQFPKIKVTYVDSSRVPLIRAADVTANWVYKAEVDRDAMPEVYAKLSQRTALLRLP